MTASAIEWCDHSINVVDGCSPASPGCDHCYAARMKGTRHAHLECALPDGQKGKNADLVTIGKTRDGGRRYVYNGKVALNAAKLGRALSIPRNGGKAGPRVFWNFQGDTFHEELSFSAIMAQFSVMAARPDLRFLVLTKRPERADDALQYFHVMATHEDRCGADSALLQCYRDAVGSDMPRRWSARMSDAWPLPNVALGVSAEDQKRWDERVPVLLDMKARGMIARAFVSAEPLLGSIDPRGAIAGLDQVIIGAESGPGARPCNLAWIRDLGGYVLDAQRRDGASRLVGGPALFVKQADVCRECAAAPGPCGTCPYADATEHDPLTGARVASDAHNGTHTGSAGKVRKGCPEFWFPEHGRGPWAQHMEGF